MGALRRSARAWARWSGSSGRTCSACSSAERRNAGPNWRNGAWTKIIRMRGTRPRAAAGRSGGSAIDLPADARVRHAHRGQQRRRCPRRSRSPTSSSGCSASGSPRAACTRAPGTRFLIAQRRRGAARARGGGHRARPRPPRGPRGTRATGARSGSIFVHSKLLLRLMDYLGFDADRKRIPGWILGPAARRLKWFLEGYREGDGVHSGKKLDDGQAARVLDRPRGAEGRSGRRIRPLRARCRRSAATRRPSSSGPAIGRTRSGA